jgi:hypothetical protein
MQNPHLIGLAQQPVKRIISRLVTESSSIFGEYHEVNYQNMVAVFARLNEERLNDENMEDLREFIDYGIVAIARRYESGQPIHPGTMNILTMAIQAYNQAHGQPYLFDIQIIRNITHPTEDFMVRVVQPMTRNLQLLALHHADWINPVFVAQEAARRAREEAPGAETHIARTLAEFRAMGGDQMEAECPLCMEEFIERPAKGRSLVFLPVVFHKDEKGKWFHPMHTVCVNDVQKEECPMCRVKVLWPRMMLTRKPTRRPNSDPTPGRSPTKHSVKRSPKSPGRSVKRSPKSPGRSVKRTPKTPGRSVKRTPKTPGRSPSFNRRSADF